MEATVYVGLAVTSRNATTRTRAVFDSVSLVTSGGNQPPAVTITQPASGTQVSTPSTVTIAASASDPESSMLAVDFYVEHTPIASATTSVPMPRLVGQLRRDIFADRGRARR